VPQQYQPVEADFGKDINGEVEWFVEQQIESLEQAHKELHLTKLPRWRRVYLGRPLEETKNTPWPNAANTIVQVVGQTVDTMVARVMGLLWATRPLWIFQNFIKTATDQERKNAEDERRVLEDFMDVVGFEPEELNLHEVEALWYTEAANLGTAFVKLSLEQDTEAEVTGYTSVKDSKSFEGKETTIYSGPRVTNLRHEDVLLDPKCTDIRKSDIVVVKRTLSRFALEERAHTGAYKREAVEAILGQPDRAVPAEPQRQEMQDQGIASPNRPDVTAEWDIYECYFPWWYRDRKYRIIYSWHKKSKTCMRRVFNFLPQNSLPVKRAKLGYRTAGAYGHGYAELLEIYQEELSTIHNQRLDNSTVANTRAFRLSPRARALDTNVEFGPAALIVAEKDEAEAMMVGDIYPSTFKNEEMTLGLVAQRAGISPAVSGMGTGGPTKQAGHPYGSQGTLAVMQENNSVVGFATSEFRHAHVMLGAAVVQMYAKFGTDGKEQMFGLDSERLQAALDKFARQKGLHIPIRAATGSLNREVEKQTGMLIAGLLQRHWTAVAQLIQAIANPMAPPEFKAYAVSVVLASELFHKKVLKDFDYDQPDLYIPEAKVGNQQPNQGANGPGQMAPGGPPMGGGPQPTPGGGAGMVPLPSMGGSPGGAAPPIPGGIK
jgi:hypothetical protein